MEIQHFSHQKHPLLLKEDKTAIDESISCGICACSNTAAPFYACDSCRYYLHKSCAELPHTLDHSFHPSHPLTLLTHRNYFCNSCYRDFSNAPSFNCDQCDFDMDVECALMPPITFTEVDQKNVIQHFSHQHLMPLVTVDKKDEINCFGCQSLLCSGDRVYGCTTCKYFLHESCAKLPKEVQCPFHWDHGLLAFEFQIFCFKCAFCKKSYETIFTFKCRQCSFQLCMKCASAMKTRGTIKYKYHEHLLCFVWEKNESINQCSNYDSYCKQPVLSYCKELSYISSCAFYCLECDFKVHWLCGPLPSTIKHECHIHPLVLFDSFIEDNSEEYYCDACEMERDPRIRVYCCEQCKYISHVHCVASEIINVLRGDIKDTDQLKNLGEDIWRMAQERDTGAAIVEEEQGKSPLTLKDIISALTEAEQRKLKKFYKWSDDVSSTVSGRPENHDSDHTAQSKLRDDEDVNWIFELSRFTFEDFEKLIDKFMRFYKNTTLELKSSDLGLKIVAVEGYKIPHTLAPVLGTLLDKYGDVSSKSTETSTKEWKSVVYFILCQFLKGMYSTKVADITTNLLQEWFYHLTFVKYFVGFKTDFVAEHLVRVVVPAFLGLQAKRLENEIPNILNLQIERLQQEIMKAKSNLEKCKEFCGSSPKSEYMKDCLNMASKLKWKNACEGLFR